MKPLTIAGLIIAANVLLAGFPALLSESQLQGPRTPQSQVAHFSTDGLSKYQSIREAIEKRLSDDEPKTQSGSCAKHLGHHKHHMADKAHQCDDRESLAVSQIATDTYYF